MANQAVELPARSIRDQGTEVNCCTSCALAACLEALHRDYPELSPLFHYYLSRPGRTGDQGITTDAALNGAYLYGLCLQGLHDHQISRRGLTEVPTAQALSDGQQRRLRDRRTGRILWQRLHSSDRPRHWKQALDHGHPLFLIIWLDRAYADMQDGGATAWEPVGPPGRQPGHAVAVLGYDDSQGCFIVQDSRGRTFGEGGQWRLPYRHSHSNMIEAAYEIRPR